MPEVEGYFKGQHTVVKVGNSSDEACPSFEHEAGPPWSAPHNIPQKADLKVVAAESGVNPNTRTTDKTDKMVFDGTVTHPRQIEDTSRQGRETRPWRPQGRKR